MNGLPRDSLISPAGFGRVDAVTWVPAASPRQKAMLSAARLQHVAALHVRMFLRAEEQTQGQLATVLGWRRERLSRLLRGQAWSTLVDLEHLLDACRASVASVSWASTPADQKSVPAHRIIAAYLRDQLQQLDHPEPVFQPGRTGGRRMDGHG